MSKTIVFIHGMFQNPVSWERWITYFTEKGYRCIAPAWPDHEGEPADLRKNIPAGLGDLRLNEIVEKIEATISSLDEKPIVIGHSVGGLITQILANKNLISIGVPISSVAPNAMLSFDWDFFSNSIKIANPFKGDEPFYMTPEAFAGAFANTLPDSIMHSEYERTATHDSRNVLRDCMMAPGHVDLDIPHVPLLFISGTEDKIIPYELVEKNAKSYADSQSTTTYNVFEGRSHYICNEPGWQEVIAYVYDWLQQEERIELPSNSGSLAI